MEGVEGSRPPSCQQRMRLERLEFAFLCKSGASPGYGHRGVNLNTDQRVCEGRGPQQAVANVKFQYLAHIPLKRTLIRNRSAPPHGMAGEVIHPVNSNVRASRLLVLRGVFCRGGGRQDKSGSYQYETSAYERKGGLLHLTHSLRGHDSVRCLLPGLSGASPLRN